MTEGAAEPGIDEVDELITQARRATDVLRDAACLGQVIGFRQRDPLVTAIHKAIDTLRKQDERLRAALAEAPPAPNGLQALIARLQDAVQRLDVHQMEGTVDGQEFRYVLVRRGHVHAILQHELAEAGRSSLPEPKT